jgi:hypothetical protein
MPDDTNKSGGSDRERISLKQYYEARSWAKSLNTTPDKLKAAVAAVGDSADKVREHLASSGR